MAYAYDKDLNKWVVLIGDVVIDFAESEEEARIKDGGEYLDEMYNDDHDHIGGGK